VSGRQDEFEQIAMPHSRSLLRVARRLTSNTSTAEDLVQETFLLAWRGFHQLREGTNARAWLFRIMFNAFYAQGRKHHPVLVLNTVDTPDSASGPLQTLEMASALAQLGEEHRTVLLLGVVEGFTCQEISGILSVPLGTVMSRLSRARKALRNQLAPMVHCAQKESQ
jgi:RNA polymerase sigma-70 factor (ECF subfamily)